MALFTFKCPTCNKVTKHIFSSKDAKKPLFCKEDQTQLDRFVQDVSTITKEVIDNGLQRTRVEQYAGAPDLLQDREAIMRAEKNKKDL